MRSIKHRGDTLAVDKHQHKSMQRWLPGRCEKTECSASGDKEKEGSGVMGRCQLKSLCKVKHNTLFFFFTLGRKHCESSIHRHSEESLCQQVSCRIICYNEGCLVMRVGSLGFHEQVDIVHISVFTPYHKNASESSDQHGTMLRRLKHIMHCRSAVNLTDKGI